MRTATQNTERLKSAIDSLWKLLLGMGTWDMAKRTPEKEAVAGKIGPAAKELLALLDYTFEDKDRQEALKKNTLFRRLVNFTKMVKEYSQTRTFEDVLAVMQEHQTKSLFASQKFKEYANEALGLITYFDSEVEDTVVHDHWTITLVSAQGRTIDQDQVSKLKEALTRVDRIMARGGVGKASGGRVFAYTGKTLGGAGGSAKGEASYNYSKDLVKVALGAPLDGLVHALVHELGHRVWFKQIGSRGREAWEEFFGENSGDPNVDQILADWERFIAQSKGKGYPESLGHYLYHLKSQGDEVTSRWLNMLASQLKIDESLDPMTGKPKGKGPSAYEQLRAKKQQAKVFLHPVSAYSGKDSAELFAEVLAYLLVGGGPVEPLVREAFRAAVPMVRLAGQYSYDRRPSQALT